MTIIRQAPWAHLNQLQEEMNRLFERVTNPEADTGSLATAEWSPAVDIKEEKERFVLYADIPGVDPQDIEITMEKGVLSIRGERRAESLDEREAHKRIERPRGLFHRRFVLPDSADAERISARGSNGVLEVTIPKHERIQPRRITVES